MGKEGIQLFSLQLGLNSRADWLFNFGMMTNQGEGKNPEFKSVELLKKLTNWKTVNFTVQVDHRIKLKESEKKDKYLDLARELKKTMEHEGDDYSNCDWCFWYSN